MYNMLYYEYIIYEHSPLDALPDVRRDPLRPGVRVRLAQRGEEEVADGEGAGGVPPRQGEAGATLPDLGDSKNTVRGYCLDTPRFEELPN